MAYCTECGKQVRDEIEFCPYCGNQLLKTVDNAECFTENLHANIIEESSFKKQKFMSCLPILLNGAVSLIVALVLAFFDYELADALFGKRDWKDFYSLNTIIRRAIDRASEVVFSIAVILTVAFVLAAIIVYIKKQPKEKSDKFNLKLFLIPFLCMPVIFFSVYGYYYSNYRPGKVKVFEKSELNYELKDAYGQTVELSDDFQDEFYDYYHTVATAYNQLRTDGDRKAFVESAAMPNDLWSSLVEFSYGQLSEIDNYLDSDERIEIPCYTSSSYALIYNHIPYWMYASDNKITEDRLEQIIRTNNILFDLFYGKLLLGYDMYDAEYDEEIVDYYEPVYGIRRGKYSNDDYDKVFEIKSLEDGKTKMSFVYDGNEGIAYTDGSVSNKFYFSEISRKGGSSIAGYGMIHVVGDYIFININYPSDIGKKNLTKHGAVYNRVDDWTKE